MTEEGKAHLRASLPSVGEHRPDPYDLYRRWFDALGARNGANRDTTDPAELEEMWKRWFEATAMPWGGTAEAEDRFPGSMAPLWSKMAEDASAKMATSDEGLPEDPLRSFVQWYKDTETRWSEEADEFLSKDEVLEQAGRRLEAGARSYDEFRRASEEGLKRLQVPTRSDVAGVAKLVVVVENKVDRIEEAFEDFIHGDAEPATGEAMSSLEERMDRLEDKMDRILASLERLEAKEQPDSEASPRPAAQRDQRSAGEPGESLGEARSIEAKDPGC